MKKKKHKNRTAAGKQAIRAGGKELAVLVRNIAEPFFEAEGIEFVHVEHLSDGGGRVLRVFMDKPGGTTLDDCVYVSRQLGDLLDIEIEDDIPYRLEVSSPGPDRPLGKEEDFHRFRGNMAKIKTERPVDGQKNFTGELLGVQEGNVRMKVDGQILAFPCKGIIKANLINYNGDD